MSYAENPFSSYLPEEAEPCEAQIRGDFGLEPPEGLLTLQDDVGYDESSPVAEGMTFDVISEKYQQFLNAWVEHPLHRVGYKTLKSSILKQEGLQITHAVCLGLGSFTGAWPDGSVDVSFQEKILWQLLAFESWIDQLRECKPIIIFSCGSRKLLAGTDRDPGMVFDIEHIYFQDPAFSKLDRKFLRSQGTY